MESLFQEILERLKTVDSIPFAELAGIIRRHNQSIHDVSEHLSKKKVMRYYLDEKNRRSELWESWNIDRTLDERLIKTLQVKPRRTASGVATITVITKPMPCSGTCVFCPNDIRMPKSYLTDEPACQRAERSFFDPYLQVITRLKALREMGHETDKVELIVLGGTWTDYSLPYQLWFVKELFRALNDGKAGEQNIESRRARYEAAGLTSDSVELAQQVLPVQQRIDSGELTYNQAHGILYGSSEPWQAVSEWQCATFEELEHEHQVNETACHRVVGLVVETRPDAVSVEELANIRRMGCTKVQIGIQTLDENVMTVNNRSIDLNRLADTFTLLRLFGFKIHSHFMVNLMGSTPESDLEDYRKLVYDAAYIPDEVKLYPCVLVESAGLTTCYDKGLWRPYDEEVLIEVLAEDVLSTPPYVRISRMIRDISAHDIKAGNRKTNLRQLVEGRCENRGVFKDREIRSREISVADIKIDNLVLDEIRYETSSTSEFFLQWITPEGRIAGFLRLSLPHLEAVEQLVGLPVRGGQAMIREVHVYGRAAKIHDVGMGAQHLGLGRKLIERACEIARAHGYREINVISSVGTRVYYRNNGFEDNGLYQTRTL